MTHDPREALDSLLAFRHGDTKHLTAEHARILYEALTTSAPKDTSPPPAAGWDEAVDAAAKVARMKYAGSNLSNIGNLISDEILALRREAPAPSGVATVTVEEVRLRARLAWNNWPDSEQSRRLLAEAEKKDDISRIAWDRVVAAVMTATSPAAQLDAPHNSGERLPDSDVAEWAAGRPDAGGGGWADERERLIAFADYYLANNAAENGTAELIRQLRDALLATQPITDPVYKAVERILDEKSAWIAGPNDEVTKSIALQAVAAAHKIIAESCSICGGEYPVEAAISTTPAAAESNASAEARLRVKTTDGFEVETLQSGRITKIISGPYSEAASTNGDEAKKSEGGTFTNCASCDMPRTCLDHGRCFGPSDPPDRRKIVARIIDPEAWWLEPWNENWSVVAKRKQDKALAKADAILAALDGGR